jgi:hypothetical protein
MALLCTAQHSTAQRSAAQRSAAQHSAAIQVWSTEYAVPDFAESKLHLKHCNIDQCIADAKLPFQSLGLCLHYRKLRFIKLL